VQTQLDPTELKHHPLIEKEEGELNLLSAFGELLGKGE